MRKHASIITHIFFVIFLRYVFMENLSPQIFVSEILDASILKNQVSELQVKNLNEFKYFYF